MAGPAALPLLLVFGIVGLVVVGIVVVATSPTRNRSRRHSGGSTTSPIANYQPSKQEMNAPELSEYLCAVFGHPGTVTC